MTIFFCHSPVRLLFNWKVDHFLLAFLLQNIYIWITNKMHEFYMQIFFAS